MIHAHRIAVSALAGCVLASACWASAQDWPQWRGPNRDGKASGFNPPKTWPKELTQKWKVAVGRGDATPALVGDKLYVFARQDEDEVIRCLDAGTGKEIWQDKYAVPAISGPDASVHSGPRSSPATVDGKVFTLGVGGTVSCVDAGTGKMAWRKDDFAGSWPRFHTSCSPLVTGGLCIVQLGAENKGGVVAYDSATGNQKWTWTADGTAYSSPVLLEAGGTPMVVAMTANKVVGLGIRDGKLLWEVPFKPQGMSYNAAEPIVQGETVIFTGAGRGTRAVKVAKTTDGFETKELWSSPENAVQFNTPVCAGAQLYGISQRGDLFCLDKEKGTTLWTSPIGGRGFGSIVEAGPVLMVLTPQKDLMVVEPNDKELKKLATYKVADTDPYAHPVVAGNRLYVKDRDSVILWTFD